MTTIDFEPYDSDELSQIIKLCLPEIIFADGVLDEISETIRGNARSAVKRAKEIQLYCGAKSKITFNEFDFMDLADKVGILPYGITFTEKQILEVLNNCGSCTLTGLSAKLGMSKTSVQRDHELYLLNKNLMEIDGKRKITAEGQKLCEVISV